MTDNKKCTAPAATDTAQEPISTNSITPNKDGCQGFRQLSRDEYFKVRSLHTKGATNAEICSQLSLEPDLLTYHMSNMRLRPHTKEPVKPSEFATRQSIPQPSKKAPSVWTPELEAVLTDLYNRGELTHSQMAEKLGINPNLIGSKLTTMRKAKLIPWERPVPVDKPKPVEQIKPVEPKPQPVAASVPAVAPIPAAIVELVRTELECLREEFTSFEAEYLNRKSIIAEFENFLKECE